VSKVQGGWSSDKSQTRYDRSDLADIVRIPGAIVSSWANREVDFDFAAILQPADDGPRPGPVVRALSAPVERAVEPQAVRNVRVAQPYASGASSSSRVAAVPTASGVAPSSSLDTAQVALSAAGQPSSPRRVRRANGVSQVVEQAPVALPPPPPHGCAQRRVADSPHLSLTRPQRASRLVGVSRMPAGVSGSWRSAT
jgi:hypothetical protein